MHIAILGTGIMGAPMAERLIESGHTVAVYNRTPEKIKPLVDLGAHPFSVPAQAVKASDAVILMLSDINAINAVLFGPAKVSFKNRTVIQMGTIAPEESMRVARRVARSGGEVSLSWLGVRGTYYSVMYTEARGAKAKWQFLPDAVNIPGLETDEPIVVKDRVDPAKPRYYRLVQDSKPLVP